MVMAVSCSCFKVNVQGADFAVLSNLTDLLILLLPAKASSLTCSSFPHVLGRMGKLEVVDRRLFCLAAVDFFRQLTNDLHRRSFMATFQSVASSDSPYSDLLICLTNTGKQHWLF